MTDIIHVKNLTKRFGRFTAVNNISFSIKKGEILGFIGPNGAGKTTTIKMIIGLLKPTSGDIRINNTDALKQEKELKKIIGYMSQKFSLYPLLTSLENITFFGGVMGLQTGFIKNKCEDIKTRVPSSLLHRKTADIPPGIRQKIALFVCLMTDPEIIFLDEPTSGVDPEVRREFWMEIYRLKKKGKTILVSTHNLDEVEYADRILIIHQGNLILQGEPESLREKFGKNSIEEIFKTAISKHESNQRRI
ncbi:MAG: ABC transporter ATP-binding protein [Candidatus Aminicenantes bacterium]|nr:ABC transporter ATP-binding protein [Candidatus Aminicenantes bacterium]